MNQTSNSIYPQEFENAVVVIESIYDSDVFDLFMTNSPDSAYNRISWLPDYQYLGSVGHQLNDVLNEILSNEIILKSDSNNPNDALYVAVKELFTAMSTGGDILSPELNPGVPVPAHWRTSIMYQAPDKRHSEQFNFRITNPAERLGMLDQITERTYQRLPRGWEINQTLN